MLPNSTQEQTRLAPRPRAAQRQVRYPDESLSRRGSRVRHDPHGPSRGPLQILFLFG